MLITLTATNGQPVPINPDHIIWVELMGGERPYRKIHHTRGELAVAETWEEIVARCNPAVSIAPLELKGDEQDVEVATEALSQAVRTGKRERKG
jgi:hypothetical protein